MRYNVKVNNQEEKMLYRAPRGTLDILPEDQPYWRHIYERIHHICALYGYRQIETPIFERLPSLWRRGRNCIRGHD